MIKLYNTLGRRVEELKPIKDGTVSLYTCGPTVYDHQTIGNLRTYVFFDSLKRTLLSNGYKVDHVMNITDVGHLTSDADEGEDKLEKGAQKAGKTVWEVAQAFTEEFKHDLHQLNILAPQFAKATDYISQQVELVSVLLDKGYAYQTDQAIYFDVSKLDSYGNLTGQKLSDKEVAARKEVVTDPSKRHPQDFAVWFFTVGHFKDHTMHWPSPWGEGFPGWHLECSAIVHATLGDPIDIHSGAVDLIGTHHTNEIAQTQAAYDNQLANYWVHSEHLLVNGQRMGKSLGNFYSLQDVVDKKYDPLALRLLYLQAHYRSQLNFTWESLDAAASFLKTLRDWADLRHQPSADTMDEKLDHLFRDTRQKMLDRMNDDLDSPGALSALSELVSYMQTIPIPGKNGKYSDGTLKSVDSLLGLGLDGRPDITPAQKDLINEREAARENGDWAKSDKLRETLKDKKIEINDTAYGPVWSRT